MTLFNCLTAIFILFYLNILILRINNDQERDQHLGGYQHRNIKIQNSIETDGKTNPSATSHKYDDDGKTVPGKSYRHDRNSKNTVNSSASSQKYISRLELLRLAEFSSLENVTSPDPSCITIALVIIQDTTKKEQHIPFTVNMKKMLGSLFTHSSGSPLHFVIITIKNNIQDIGLFFSDLISKQISENVIESDHWKWKKFRGFPKLKITFVDIEDILQINKPFLKALKNNGVGKSSTKYAADLFYITPLFHLAFSSFDKIILLDSTDLEFYCNINLLAKQFDNMVAEVIGVGLDLSPHYRQMLEQSGYITSHPGSMLGKQGRFQGLNMGVVLFRLDKMRSSKLYNSHLNAKVAIIGLGCFSYVCLVFERL